MSTFLLPSLKAGVARGIALRKGRKAASRDKGYALVTQRLARLYSYTTGSKCLLNSPCAKPTFSNAGFEPLC